MKKTRAVLGILILTLSLVSFSGVAVAEERTLEDGSIYWQGTTLVKSGYAPNEDTATLYKQSGSEVREVELSDGDLILETGDLEGGYYVQAPNATRIDFEVIVQEVNVRISNFRIEGDAPKLVADVGVSTNRGGQSLELDGNFNLAERVIDGEYTKIDEETIRFEGTGGSVTVSLEGMGAEQHSLSAVDPESEITGVDIFEITETMRVPNGPTVAAERGESYWRPSVLIFDVNSSKRYQVQALNGTVMHEQLATQDNELYVGTKGLPAGIYRVIDPDNESEVTRFELKVHQITMNATEGSLQIDSNRDEYSATIRVWNGSTNVTSEVLVNTSAERGIGTLNGLSQSESLSLDTQSLPQGEYNISVNSKTTDASATVTFVVSEPEPTITTTDVGNTTTESTNETTEPGTPTRTTSQTVEETNTTSPPNTGTSASTPGFGWIPPALAIILTSGLLQYRRE